MVPQHFIPVVGVVVLTLAGSAGALATDAQEPGAPASAVPQDPTAIPPDTPVPESPPDAAPPEPIECPAGCDGVATAGEQAAEPPPRADEELGREAKVAERRSARAGRRAPRKAAPRARAAASQTVQMRDFAFSPSSVTVNVGDSVTWSNRDPEAHTATARDGSWDTGLIQPRKTGSITFRRAGRFAYYCVPHPFMKGTVTVVAASGGESDGAGSDQEDGGGTAGEGASSASGSGLPDTGLDLAPRALFGAALLAAGIALLLLARRRAPGP